MTKKEISILRKVQKQIQSEIDGKKHYYKDKNGKRRLLFFKLDTWFHESDCGTVACIAGHICVNEKINLGVISLDAVALFNYDLRGELRTLFDPWNRGLSSPYWIGLNFNSKADVITAIERFIEINEK